MNENNLKGWYFPIFCLFIVLFAAFESAIWKNLFEFLPSPLLWLSVIVYVSITRPTVEVLILIYLSSFFLQTMTVMPIGYLLFTQTVIMLTVKTLKSRIFWDGRTYFIFLNLIGLISFHVQHILLTMAFEDNPIQRFEILSWIGEIFTFILLSPIVYWVFSSILPLRDSQLDDAGMVVDG